MPDTWVAPHLPEVYHWTYAAAFVGAFAVVAIWRGHRSTRPASMAIAAVAVVVAAVVGAKLASLEPAVILSAVKGDGLPLTSGKSFVGALVGVAITAPLCVRWLRLPTSLLRDYAFMLPAGLVAGRVGCFFAGCCPALVTELPWGIRYAAGTHVHTYHLSEGLIGVADTVSLPIHPLPLYDLIAMTTVIALIVGWRRLRSAPVFAFVLSLTLCAATRFAIEWIMAGSTRIAGMTGSQWVLVAIMGISGAVLVSGYTDNTGHSTSSAAPDWFRPALVTAVSGGVIVLWWTRFSPLEQIVIGSTSVATLLFVAVAAVPLVQPSRRRLAVGLVSLALLILGFTTQQDPSADSTETRRSTRYSLGFLRGEYVYESEGAQEEDCGDPSDDLSVPHESWEIFGGLERRTPIPGTYRTNVIGLEGIVGRDRSDAAESEVGTTVDESKGVILGLRGYVGRDRRWFGFRFGAYLGATRSPVAWLRRESSGNVHVILPDFQMRVGRLDRLYAETGIWHFPPPGPAGFVAVGARAPITRDVGLGLRYVRLGADLDFLEPTIFLRRQFELSGLVPLRQREEFYSDGSVIPGYGYASFLGFRLRYAPQRPARE